MSYNPDFSAALNKRVLDDCREVTEEIISDLRERLIDSESHVEIINWLRPMLTEVQVGAYFEGRYDASAGRAE